MSGEGDDRKGGGMKSDRERNGRGWEKSHSN